MKWFKKWIFRMTKEGSSLASDEGLREAKVPTLQSHVRSIDQAGINFSIYKANGGYVMECRTYDRKTDRNDARLHIITSEQDLGQQIAHIITFEALQQ